ncbi:MULTISPECIES: K+/H+ antiporter subunit F [Oceanibaculum]|uniref:Multicomponent K+:H+ antiporter subunit F n=1 Tax=Oceanibaculum indicum TaxID=526216 RepID=A0A420WP66_9PROT|nr:MULTISPECIES: K+/H+ antiporter subunit F [Oceanibaculum]MCH2394434.1 K+/H+ antiporter subunit F [Oceanibaculum sp.]RKQ72655.1 multicomponent K+:H+ antiporter subunit F [Oceanibaculum indicum]
MIFYAIAFCFACIGLALLMNLWRLATGPTTPDRILALDTMTINAIALIVLYSLMSDTSILFEAAILFAMVGFISTVAYCKFLLRGDVIE